MAKSKQRRLCNMRRRMALKQGNRCYYCHIKLTERKRGGERKLTDMTFDHVIPLSKGGVYAPSENAVIACYRCNSNRGDEDFNTFKDRFNDT